MTRSKQVLAEARSERAKSLGEANEGLRIACERTSDVNAPEEDRFEKLKGIERAWQHLEETKSITIEEVRDAKTDYTNACKALEQAVVESRQTTLDFSAEASG